jgi:hypothetical protein
MTREDESQSNITQAKRLKPYGITLRFLATTAKRSPGYVKLWSSGVRKSPHLDAVAGRLIKSRTRELQKGADQS